MKYIYFLGFIFLITSCIPLRIAPNIDNHKITVGKKFKRSLPKEHVFIFEDPKDADEFYYYINAKFDLNNIDVEYNVPLEIDGVTYYLSFYETEVPTKTVNLLPMAVDLATRESNFQTDFSGSYTSRTGNWYIALSVTDDNIVNSLEPLYPFRQFVVDYLEELRLEYLSTHDYSHLAFKKKP